MRLDAKSCIILVGGIALLIVANAFVFSLIFWLLTFLAKWMYSNKYFNYKLNFYECGFKSLTNVRVNYNINFILLLLFILVYDGEFLILIPFSLNVTAYNLTSILILVFFIIWLIFSLFVDYAYNALDWQITW